MKLARNFSVVLALVVASVFVGVFVFQVEREMSDMLTDIEGDHRLLGEALAGSFISARRLDGEAAAIEALAQANRFQSQVRVRWVWLDGAEPRTAPQVSRDELRSLGPERYVAFQRPGKDGRHPVVVSYVPVDGVGRRGAIELTEPFYSRWGLLARAAGTISIAALFLAAFFVATVVVLGRALIGKPIAALVRLAEQLGSGDFDARILAPRRDELGLLAEAMNRMADGLKRATAQVLLETSAKVAAQESLRHADRLTTVGKLAAGVAHELGTPLNVVDGRAKMIAAGEARGDGVTRAARIISEQVTAMTRIIRQLLDFARRRPSVQSEQQLKPIVVRTLELLHPLADKRGVKLVDDVPEALKARVDAAAMQQVLTNLLMNSIQATQQSGEVRVCALEERRPAPPELHVAEEAWLRLDVEDQGAGISAEIRQHIFEPFFTTKAVGEGTGLGLSVSYGIVSDHGGWIEIDPVRAVGTRFSVYLPHNSAPS